MTKKEWTDDYFNEFYFKIYSTKLIPPHITKLETNFILKYLKLKKTDLILDIATGYCRHQQILEKKGFKTVGLERSIYFLKNSQLYKKSSVNTTLINSDMRDLPLKDETFDKVYLMFNSFGYFSDEENIKVLKEVHRVLKKGGLFLLDLPDKETVLDEISESPMSNYWEEDFEINEKWAYDKKNKIIHNKTEFVVDGSSHKTEFYVRMYAKKEIEKIFSDLKFKINGVYGEFDGASYDDLSTKMIFIVEKL